MKNQQQYKLSLAASHHIQSFNYALEKGLQKVLQRLPPMEIFQKDVNSENQTKEILLPFKNFKLGFLDLKLGQPFRNNDPTILQQQIYPQECRQAGKTYSAPLLCEVSREIDGNVDSFTVSLGQIPIMVKSKNCHLAGLTEQQLIKLNEDPNEFGGYFIVNGNEKIVRMLIIQKRNYPVAFLRPSYTNRGPGYTEFAVQMRCVRDDFYAKTFTLHYIADGNVYLRILYKKQEFLIPITIILKGIGSYSDRQVYTRLMKGHYQDSGRSDKIEVVLKTGRSLGLYNQTQFLEYLGKNFRLLLGVSVAYSDKQAGEIFLNQNICPHLNTEKEKFNTLCLAIDKLYALVNEEIQPENLDSMAVHEALLPGHLYLMILREKLEETLSYVRGKLLKDGVSQKKLDLKMLSIENLKKLLETGIIGKSIEYFLSTGNLKSRTGLDLMQDKGFAVIADKLNNMRFLSHFRSIHRGAYFAEMKTTTVRKLLPECWGFLCPVHTPDGGPCGLLNHITISCCPLTYEAFDEESHENIHEICVENGMISLDNYNYVEDIDCYPVMINGYHAGYVDTLEADDFVNSLKMLKIKGEDIPKETEIAYMKKRHFKNTIYPIIFICTSPARFLRPVKYVALDQIEWISPFEQLNMDIDLPESNYTQISHSNILSILPQHIPFLNYNQSPRNMYQCQMSKQTMGTSVLNWDYRFDNKLYRILHSQKPLVRTKFYENFKFSDYNSGTNAVVAVLSYTGYDMQDAMIINKSSYENGFGHGIVYKTVEYLLHKDQGGKKPPKFKLFKDAPLQMQKLFELPQQIQSDGMIRVGAKLKKFCPVLVVYEESKKSFKTFYNKQSEQCFVQSILLTGGENKAAQKVLIKLRFDRRPVIGDKFSSRHGQKGVLSMLWPKIDMPFTETGMTPDIIINPNAFPSRMTIGMLIESLAAKSSALQGEKVEYEAFQAYENDNVIDYFGKKLLDKGFNYYGNQTMYSGTYGTQLQVDIFIGLVYYQRLRHMVHDKSQARSTGPVDILTQQPLKGRKKGGGIRMGEMERDAMLAHGLSQVVNERLFKSSDKSEGYVCNKCGSMLSAFKKVQKISGQSLQQVYKRKTICKGCNSEDCSLVAIPYVMKYLINELGAMNIKIKFKLKA